MIIKIEMLLNVDNDYAENALKEKERSAPQIILEDIQEEISSKFYGQVKVILALAETVE